MFMFALAFTALLATQTEGGSAEAMPVDDAMVRESVSADFFLVPANADPRQFAQDLLTAEGLRQWDGGNPIELRRPEVSLLSMTAGDGRNIRVLFGPRNSPTPAGVCRVRAEMNGTGPASYRASRWCASKFGVELPETRLPPIR